MTAPDRPDRSVPRRVWMAVVFGDRAALLVPVALLVTYLAVMAVIQTEWTSPTFDRTTAGVATKVTRTSHRTLGRKRVSAIDATFTDDAGHARTVRSYIESHDNQTGPVQVEYRQADPTAARIVGMRTRPRGPASNAVVAVLLVVFWLQAVRAVRATRRNLHALRHAPEATLDLAGMPGQLALRGGVIESVAPAWRLGMWPALAIAAWVGYLGFAASLL